MFPFPGGHKTLALSRSSSDPSLSQSSGVTTSKHMKHHHHSGGPRRRTNRSKRSHDKSKRRSKESADQQHGGASVGTGGSGSKLLSSASSRLQRSKSMKTGRRYPSVEKLDRVRIGSDASALKKRMGGKNKNHSSSSTQIIKEEQLVSPTRHMETLVAAAKYIDVRQMEVFHVSDSKYLQQATKRLRRSISDPGLTFKKIEEKVLQRSATKKWHRAAKRGHRHRTHVANFPSVVNSSVGSEDASHKR